MKKFLTLQMGLYFFCLGTYAQLRFAPNPVVAHRGAWKMQGLPENSIAALKEAIRLGCTGSEFDVHMTSDDSLVVNHDPHYHQLLIERTPFAQLAAYKLSNGEQLPTLREYLLAGMKNNPHTRLVCEIKPSGLGKERAAHIAAKTVALVRELNAEAYTAYISFDHEMLITIERLEPAASTQFLDGNRSPETLAKNGIDGLDYHYSVFKKNEGWIKEAKKHQLILNAWTVNDAADMDWLIANEFDYITTNEPELLLNRWAAAPLNAGWKLFWSDEFNVAGLPDSTRWQYETGGDGFGNNELQFYTSRDTQNALVSNGSLKIIARKAMRGKSAYTSARLVTANKSSPTADWFKYGRVEVRAKLPAGRGAWPAIWMLGNNIEKVGWPASGEIDIMEHVGFIKDSVFGTIHSTAYNHVIGTQKMKGIFIADPYQVFHEYAIEWTADSILFMLDGVVYNKVVNEHLTTKEWPFNQPFYLLLNLAIGGNWGGKMGVDDSIFPAIFEIDYVRVYQRR